MFHVVLLAALSPAKACGGFFCDSSAPVVQNAERIVFAVDEQTELVETHVQVEYEGPSEQFAWIVPVQSEPELFLSSDVLFRTVGVQLQPQFRTQWEDEGRCKEPISLPCIACADYAMMGAPESGAGAPGVDVIGRDQVGPYDTVTLQADSVDQLMEWLTDNEYDISSEAPAALAPYVSQGAYFVALKLAKGSDTGDLAPLGFRYAGTEPAVPIQLTAVAAAPDLRLEVTVFGERRAVPSSYLHVVINDAAIDWFGGAINYPEVISRAADEAGGHAFATDFAGESSVLLPSLNVPTIDFELLASAATPGEWILAVQGSGLSGSADVLLAFEVAVPVDPAFDAQSVYNCPSCFEGEGWYAGESWSAEVANQVLLERVIEPRMAVAEMVERFPYATRMTSSISASEMTIDPTFVFTDGMGDVELVREATIVFECNGRYRRRASRRLELPSGLVVRIPSMRWFEKEGITESEFLAELGDISAGKIERTGEGEPEVLVDLTADLRSQVDFFNETGPLGRACGCQSAPTLLPGGLFAMLGLVGIRRRRR